MSNSIDSMVANLTAALEAKGMANNYVFVYVADNGGAPEGGTNWPWKGTKMNFFQGGVLGAGFVYSPLLLTAVVGQDVTGILHICDWWLTMCKLAGGSSGECSDSGPGRHPIDSHDVWPLLTGENNTSPREGFPLVLGFEADYDYAPECVYTESAYESQ